MKSFTHHLHLDGFTRKLWCFLKSGSRNDLLAEETAREFYFYYNPNFQRHFPHPLMKHKQSFGPKHQKPAGFSPDTDLHAYHQKRKSDIELAWKTTLRRTAVCSQQVQGRTCTPLHPGRLHLLSDMPRQESPKCSNTLSEYKPSASCPVPFL